MPVRTIKHGEHQHEVKVINETVLNLVIDDREHERISEAFGWSDEKFDKLVNTMFSFYKLQDAAEELNEDMPQSTKISSFVEFLKSNPFKALGIKIETPNDYLMLGYSWNMVLMKRRGIGMESGIPISGRDLMGLLAGLTKHGEGEE